MREYPFSFIPTLLHGTLRSKRPLQIRRRLRAAVSQRRPQPRASHLLPSPVPTWCSEHPAPTLLVLSLPLVSMVSALCQRHLGCVNNLAARNSIFQKNNDLLK